MEAPGSEPLHRGNPPNPQSSRNAKPDHWDPGPLPQTPPTCSDSLPSSWQALKQAQARAAQGRICCSRTLDPRGRRRGQKADTERIKVAAAQGEDPGARGLGQPASSSQPTQLMRGCVHPEAGPSAREGSQRVPRSRMGDGRLGHRRSRSPRRKQAGRGLASGQGQRGLGSEGAELPRTASGGCSVSLGPSEPHEPPASMSGHSGWSSGADRI